MPNSVCLPPIASATPLIAETSPFFWQHRHVLDSHTLNRPEVDEILTHTRSFAEILKRPTKKVPTLRGKTVATVFYENSTRTRSSFELAAKYLSADVLQFDVSNSSVKKGESLIDTIDTLVAMGIDALVLRHASSGVCHQLAQHFGNRLCILNAGDGQHDHPSQGLLDLFSLTQRLGDIAGKKIVIAGDIRHSRVARSNLHLLNLYGADVHVVGPSTLLPQGVESLGCTVHTDLESALLDADVVMCLRLQLERQQAGLIPSLSEYHRLYGITLDRVQRFCKPAITIMHPGPMNRGVELSSEVADHPEYTIISEQVSNGVAVRMSLLYLTLTTQPEEAVYHAA